MAQPLTIDGRILVTISQDIYDRARLHLPRVPAQPGVRWVHVTQPHPVRRRVATCWVATYCAKDMQPEHFNGWECLNPREDHESPLQTVYRSLAQGREARRRSDAVTHQAVEGSTRLVLPTPRFERKRRHG